MDDHVMESALAHAAEKSQQITMNILARVGIDSCSEC